MGDLVGVVYKADFYEYDEFLKALQTLEQIPVTSDDPYAAIRHDPQLYLKLAMRNEDFFSELLFERRLARKHRKLQKMYREAFGEPDSAALNRALHQPSDETTRRFDRMWQEVERERRKNS